ncbi:MAG: chemotaxis protein CheA [Bdellovibrionota bacterium]
MDEFEEILKRTFIEEAHALLEESEEYYLHLEENSDIEILDAIFRNAHSFKGSSRAAGFEAIGALTHRVESLLLKIREGDIPITSEVVSLLLACNDVLRNNLSELEHDLSATFDPDPLISKIEQFEESQHSSGKLRSVSPEVSDDGLHLFDDDDDDFSEHDSFVPKEKVSNQERKLSKKGAQDEKIRVGLDKIEGLIDMVGELVILHSVLQEHVGNGEDNSLKKTVNQVGKIIKEVQDVSMGLRMVPIKAVFQKMQRIVRDTALHLNKKVSMQLIGEEVEVDKTVLDKIGDPLVHITRNAVDHGIEMPDERKENGKPEGGSIVLKAFHESGRLIVSMEDDGKGIDPEVIKNKAIEKGLISSKDNFSDEEALQLIMKPGFSTKTEVSDLSGRGVGMDVVKTNVEALSGEINVYSTKGYGSNIKISLPLTLAIIDGMILSASGGKFVIPLNAVVESVNITESNIKFLSGVGEVLVLRGENIPLICLDRVLDLKTSGDLIDPIAVVVSSPKGHYAIAVDDIISRGHGYKAAGKRDTTFKGVVW